jgi:regulator of protease activity HflC (stomatin/prohibitin superfamily)
VVVVLLLVAALVAGVGAWWWTGTLRDWLLTLAAALLPSALALGVVVWCQAEEIAAARRRVPPASFGRWGEDDPLARVVAEPRASDGRGHAAMGLLAGLAVLGLVALSRWPLGVPDPGVPTLVPGLVFLVLLLPLLVLEPAVQPLEGGARLLPVLRLPMITLLIGGVVLMAARMGWPGLGILLVPVQVLVAAIGLEVVGRSVVHLVMGGGPKPVVSQVADGLLAHLNPGATLRDLLRHQAGLEVSRSWSLRVVRAALLPVIAGLAVIAWLLTALTSVDLGQRVVLQQGTQARVLGAGLHVHRPWPWRSLRRIDDGRVRETILGTTDQPLPVLAAEAEPGPLFDRRWEAGHPAESTLVIPSADKAGFQAISADLRVFWSVGPTNDDAIALVGQVAAPEALVTAAARQAVTAAIARLPLEELVGSDRQALSGLLTLRTQERLDALAGGRCGLRVVQVVVDAIHPPVGAASAYQGVQASEILSRVGSARARSEAAREVAAARGGASVRAAAATATAAEVTLRAQAEAHRFAADHAAWTQHREAVATERWLEGVRAALSKGPVTILDATLPPANLDLRPAGRTTP